MEIKKLIFLDDTYLENCTLSHDIPKEIAEISNSFVKITTDKSTIQYVNLDFAVQYVRGVFSVIGINKVKIIRSQGLDLVHNDKQAIVENTKEELIKHINSL